MPEPVEVNTFENLKDVKSLAQWVAEKNEEVQRYIKASDGKWDDDRVAILDSRTKELEAAQGRLTQLQKVEDIYNKTVERKKDLSEPAAHVPFENNGGDQTISQAQGNGSVKSIGELFTENKTYKSFGSHEESNKGPFSIQIPDYGYPVKTVMTTSAGFAPANPRTNINIPYAQRAPRVADIVPVSPTQNTSIFYMTETTALAGTNAQVGTAENAAKWENTLAFTQVEAKVGLIATWLPVTLQQLDDVPGMQEIINNRMDTFIRLKEEDMLMTGTGVAPINITGFLVAVTQAQALGVDTNIDAVFRAIQKVRTVGFAEPDAIIMHPDNFTPIALYKSNTGEFGFNVTVDNAGITRLFGKILVLSPAITVGTALVGDFATYSHISRKMGLTITVGLNSDDFTKNKRTILAEMRESLEVYRIAAFCKVTGLTSGA
jgi:HK97 family phage major capsid protein